jgi:hypothetical protein
MQLYNEVSVINIKSSSMLISNNKFINNYSVKTNINAEYHFSEIQNNTLINSIMNSDYS